MSGEEHGLLGWAWSELSLETEAGTWSRRVHEEVPLFISRSEPSGNAALELRLHEPIQVDPKDLKDSEEFTIRVDPQRPGTLQVATRTRNAVELFLRIAEDLADKALKASAEKEAVRAVVRRFNTWQLFLKTTRSGLLSSQKRQGLFGELAVLRDLLIPVVGALKAVDAWTGPSGEPQDFQIFGTALEVKTIGHTEPQTLTVTSERQLDDRGLSLLVLVHHRAEARRGSNPNLPDLVSDLRNIIGLESITALETFEEKLLGVGYHEDERTLPEYSAVGYLLHQTDFYRVEGDRFPRLTPLDLKPGVGGLRYEVASVACQPFAISRGAVIDHLANPSSDTASDSPGLTGRS